MAGEGTPLEASGARVAGQVWQAALARGRQGARGPEALESGGGVPSLHSRPPPVRASCRGKLPESILQPAAVGVRNRMGILSPMLIMTEHWRWSEHSGLSEI